MAITPTESSLRRPEVRAGQQAFSEQGLIHRTEAPLLSCRIPQSANPHQRALLSNLSPVRNRRGPEPGLVTKVTEFLGAVTDPARAEGLAAVGAKRLRGLSGEAHRNKQVAFHQGESFVQYLEQ